MEGSRELGTGNSSNCTTELERLAEAAASVGYSDSLSTTPSVTPFTQSETFSTGSLVPASTHRATVTLASLSQTVTLTSGSLMPAPSDNTTSTGASFTKSETLTSASLIPATAHHHIHHAHNFTNEREYKYSEAHVHETDIDASPTITQKRSLPFISTPPAHVQHAVHYNDNQNLHLIKSQKVTYMAGPLKVPQQIELKLSVPPATHSTVIQCNPPQFNFINPKADSKYTSKVSKSIAVSLTNELTNQPEIKKLKKNSYAISKSKDFVSSITNEDVEESHEDEIGNPHDDVDIPTAGSVLPCDSCGEQFSSLELWKLHQIDHSVARRRIGLPLEIKIEMIKRITGGEKQADMAEEYGVKPSTVKSIMKKSSSYMACWKKGMFHPDSMRLKGPKREDIEAALHAWYNQAMLTRAPVSGPILCAKALDFAKKLGHTDFKATHGWLDRFKKRKRIVFGRNLHRKKKNEEEGSGSSEVKLGEWQAAILPQVLLEYQPGDIFAVEETGLLYKALPDMAFLLKGEKCPGGIRSRQRITVLLCANMTGTEKFPLLVVGRHNKPASFRNVKSLPVQYVSNQSAWMTSDSFGAWLQDIDSWFVQQNRCVVVLASSLPVNQKPPGFLRAVKLVTCPSGYIGPLQYGVVKALKKQYRRSILEILVTILEREENKKNNHSDKYNLTLLICLQSLTNAWHNVNEGCINASFTKAGISKFSAWGAPHPREDPVTSSENLTLLHRLRSLGHNMHDITFDEFVHFDDHVQVCNLMNDDDIVASVTGLVSEEDDALNDCEEKQDGEIDGDEGIALSSKYDSPSMDDVEDALSVIRRHIQYQECHEEMSKVLDHLEFLIFKEQPDKGEGTVQPNAQTSQ